MTNYKALALPLIAIALLSCREGRGEITKMTYTFKQVGDLEIKADVFRPDDNKARPVVAWLPGGALINGHRESVPKWLAEACRERGYVLVSFDYRQHVTRSPLDVVVTTRHPAMKGRGRPIARPRDVSTSRSVIRPAGSKKLLIPKFAVSHRVALKWGVH